MPAPGVEQPRPLARRPVEQREASEKDKDPRAIVSRAAATRAARSVNPSQIPAHDLDHRRRDAMPGQLLQQVVDILAGNEIAAMLFAKNASDVMRSTNG
jgi:hypothetical protein